MKKFILTETELINERMNVAATAEPYVGKYFSQDYVRRKILRQTDEEIIEQDKLIEKEIKDGTIPDPATIDPATGLPLMDAGVGSGADPNSLAPVADPDLEGETLVSKQMPKGGEI